MGQEEIIKALESNPNKEFTSSELLGFVDCESPSIRTVLRKLLKDPFVKIRTRELTFEEKKMKYGKVVNPKIIVYWVGLSTVDGVKE